VQVLGEDVDALRQLLEAHLRDVTRHGRLRAHEALRLEQVHQRALRLDALVSDDALDRVLTFESLPHCGPNPPYVGPG